MRAKEVHLIIIIIITRSLRRCCHPPTLCVCGRGGGCARKQIANGMVVISLIAARQQTSLYYNLVFVNKSSRCAIIKKNVNHRIN